MLSKADVSNLKRINKMLRESFDYKTPLDSRKSKDELLSLREDAMNTKHNIMETAEFNTYHRDPQYNQAMLVLEACNILLGKKTDVSILDVARKENKMKADKLEESVSTHDKILELKKLYESYVAKNGEDEKAKELGGRITTLEKKLYETKASQKLNLLLKEDADKAETIMTAQGLMDDMLGYQAKIGDIENKYLDPFIAMVRTEYSNDMAEAILSKLTDSLDNLMNAVKKTKNDFSDVVATLSGEKELEGDMVSDESDIGSMEDELSDESASADELDADLTNDEGETADETVSDTEIDFGLEDEEPEEEFVRKEE